jgi:hypothetical protein
LFSELKANAIEISKATTRNTGMIRTQDP